MSRPAKKKLNPAVGGPMFFPSVHIDTASREQVLSDPFRRHWVADRIESFLLNADFSRHFGQSGGGIHEEMERVKCWLEWRTESPEYLLAQAWEDSNPTRAELLAKWLLLKGSPDRKNLSKLLEGLPVEILEETKHGILTIPNPSTAHQTIRDAAFILALMACNPPQNDGKVVQSRLPALVANEMIKGDPRENRDAQQRLKNLEREIRPILKKLGFKNFSMPPVPATATEAGLNPERTPPH